MNALVTDVALEPRRRAAARVFYFLMGLKAELGVFTFLGVLELFVVCAAMSSLVSLCFDVPAVANLIATSSSYWAPCSAAFSCRSKRRALPGDPVAQRVSIRVGRDALVGDGRPDVPLRRERLRDARVRCRSGSDLPEYLRARPGTCRGTPRRSAGYSPRAAVACWAGFLRYATRRS